MKPALFKYAAPSTVDETLALLESSSGGARLLAGGQSLVPMMNLRLATPAALVDLNRVEALAHVSIGASEVRIGAMTRHRTLEISPELRATMPILARAAAEIGHVAIRNRGTIGGALAHADPAAEWPLVASALDASIVIRSARGEREIAAREFFIAPMTTSIDANELLTEVRFPRMPGRVAYGFSEMSRRRGDFAIATALGRAIFDISGHLLKVELCIGGAHPVPLIVPGLDGLVSNHTDEALREAAQIAAKAVEPGSDIHASADFRRRVTATLAHRALAECFAQPEGTRAHA